MGDPSLERAVLFADVAGSVRLFEEVGEAQGRALVVQCLDDAVELIEQAGGTVVERVGDELMCTFGDPSAAAICACDLQRAVLPLSQALNGRRRLRLRIGFEYGAVAENEDGLFGSTLHIAARLVKLAKAGQALTTHATLQSIDPSKRPATRFYDRRVLRGITGEHEVHELVWKDDATIIRPFRKSRQQAIEAVEVAYEGETRTVDASAPCLEVGRGRGADLRVNGACVSSLHARIVWSGGRAFLDDVSSNGTYLAAPTRKPVFVHRERVALPAAGTLSLGGPASESGAATLSYKTR